MRKGMATVSRVRLRRERKKYARSNSKKKMQWLEHWVLIFHLDQKMETTGKQAEPTAPLSEE